MEWERLGRTLYADQVSRYRAPHTPTRGMGRPSQPSSHFFAVFLFFQFSGRQEKSPCQPASVGDGGGMWTPEMEASSRMHGVEGTPTRQVFGHREWRRIARCPGGACSNRLAQGMEEVQGYGRRRFGLRDDMLKKRTRKTWSRDRNRPMISRLM
jgi:hypothetical protein